MLGQEPADDVCALMLMMLKRSPADADDVCG